MEQTKQYGYVDLGLPSGLKWAKRNVGAETETDYGYYFQWGDIEDKSNADCNWESYKYWNDTEDTMTKYNTLSEYGENLDGKTTLDLKDDAARVHMGGDWRMPTDNDFQELLDNTTIEWITNFNGSDVNGMKFISKADTTKYIFIPASGYRAASSFYDRGRYGSVWSSSLYAVYPNLALDLYFFGPRCIGTGNYGSDRYLGFVVRGVME